MPLLITTRTHSLPFLTLLVLQLACSPQTSRADERDDKIRVLEQRLEALEKKYQALEQETHARPPKVEEKTTAATALSNTNGTPEKNQPGQELASQSPQARPPETAKAAPSLSVGPSGFIMQSADKEFMLRFRGLMQMDSRTFFGDEPPGIDTFALRRARIIMDGKVFRDFDFLFTTDFGGSQKNIIRDAWLNYRYASELQLRGGKMKPPGNIERWEGAGNTLFIERTAVSALSPNRDLGFMLHGELWPQDEAATKRLAWGGLVNYAVGAFNGVGDGGNAEKADIDENKSVAARLFFQPFLKSDIGALQGFGFGLAGTYGQVEGRLGLPDGSGYASEADANFFLYGTQVVADGPQWRLFPQAYYYWGPFGLMAEGGFSSADLSLTSTPGSSERVQHTAWQVTASYMLTGEDATFKAVTPKHNFDPRQGDWGAWQVAVRFCQLDLDDAAFPIFADPETSVGGVSTWGVGLNWYLNRNVRASFNYLDSSFSAAMGGTSAPPNERVFLTRLQLAF